MDRVRGSRQERMRVRRPHLVVSAERQQPIWLFAVEPPICDEYASSNGCRNGPGGLMIFILRWVLAFGLPLRSGSGRGGQGGGAVMFGGPNARDRKALFPLVDPHTVWDGGL
jgi:hypothetical protein